MKRLLALLLLLSLPVHAEIVSNGASGGGGGGSGTVTSFSCVTANGVSCTVATPTTTPAATFMLGAITPSSVNGITFSNSNTPVWTVGSSSGVPVVTASSPLVITSATGNITCPTCNTSSSNVNSITGDGALINNSASTGAVTLTLTNATAKSLWGNASSSSGSPSYQTSPVVSGSMTANTLVSTVSTGTAPLTVSSTTNVANLNASSLTGDVVGTSGGTIPLLNAANTWSGVQTFTNSDIALLGSSTGATTITSDNAGGSNFTMHVPAANDTLVDLAGSQTLSSKTLSSPTLSGTVAGSNTIPLSILAQGAANTVVSNWAGSTANFVANSYPSCSDTGGNHLNYVSGTGITCGTSSGSSATILHADVKTSGTSFTSDTTTLSPLYKITLIGGGGGGGGTAAVSGIGTLNGGGGGGGGTCIVYSTLTSNTAYTYAIGAGGAGGSAGTNNGSVGGDTTITIGATTYGTSDGGAGGTGQAAASGAAPGGAGGLSSNCTANIQGGRGFFGQSATINTVTLCGAGGGSSTLGGNSREQCNGAGFAGSVYGGGGGGGADESGTNRVGGAGAQGLIIIERVD